MSVLNLAPPTASRRSAAARALRRARFAVLLAPAFLAGCYVVPVVPVVRPAYPVYRTYPGPYYGPYRGYWRGGQAEQPVNTAQAAAGPTPEVHIEVASNAR